MAALLPVVESRGCLVTFQVWGGNWMRRFRPGDLQHLVIVLRLLTRNDYSHGLGDLDRNGVDGYGDGTRIHTGRGRLDSGPDRSGLSGLDLRFRCASLCGEPGCGFRLSWGAGRLR